MIEKIFKYFGYVPLNKIKEKDLSILKLQGDITSLKKDLYDLEIIKDKEIKDLLEINSTINNSFKECYASIVLSYSDVKELIRSVSGKYEILDDVFTIPTINELRQFLHFDKTSSKQYKNIDFDCENFALETWVNAKKWDGKVAIGWCSITLERYRHSINIALVEDKGEIKIVLIEPQNDIIYDLDEFLKAAGSQN